MNFSSDAYSMMKGMDLTVNITLDAAGAYPETAFNVTVVLNGSATGGCLL